MIYMWTTLISTIGAILCFVWVFTFLFCTQEAKLQLFQWLCIKIFEKSIWTGFVALQASYFQQWSDLMKIDGEPELEAIFYVCLIPIVMNVFMFFMFSRISRFRLPCIVVKEITLREQQRFDIQEAVKVGIVFCLMVNLVIWVGCSIAFRKWEVTVVLLISVIVIPLIMGFIFILLGRFLIEKSYTQTPRKSTRS